MSIGPCAHATAMASSQSFVRLIEAPPIRLVTNRDLPALETAMHALTLDSRHPVALEIVSTSSADRQFLLRATTPEALSHLEAQLHARYPQAEVCPLDRDPLRLAPNEAASMRELESGAAPYLPLKLWKEREWQQQGTDPILGILAALQGLPQDTRAIAQLVLLPARPTWSEPFWRKVAEHPLEPERRTERREATRTQAPSTPTLVALAALVALLLLWRVYSQPLTHTFPWVGHDVALLLTGTIPPLMPLQIVTLVGVLAVLLLVVVLVTHIVARLGASPLYEQRLVAEKVKRLAYRARLRLIVIGPEPEKPRPLHALWWVLCSIGGNRVTLALLCKHVQEAWKRECKARRDARRRREEREAVLCQLVAAYRQFHQANGGYFVPRRVASFRIHWFLCPERIGLWRWCLNVAALLAADASHDSGTRLLKSILSVCLSRVCAKWTGWQCDISRSRHYLSVAEVASLWHLPQAIDLPDLTHVARGRARSFLAPRQLTQQSGWRLGVSAHAGQNVPVVLPASCLQQNMLAVASTGKGKSTLLQHLALAHLAALGRRGGHLAESLFFVEPHGDTMRTLSGCLPPALHEQVILVDLAQTDAPPALNPLDMTLGCSRDKTVDNLISIFKSIWDRSWGARTENVLEFALKTLTDANVLVVTQDPSQQYTLLDVVPLLRNHGFRHSVLAQVRDETLLQWWQQYYEPMDPRFQSEVTSSVVNKMSKYASSSLTRRILGQPISSINMSQIVREGSIVLLSTASGVIGDDASALLGATLLGLFHASIAEQAQVAPEERTRYLTLIDEFQVYRGARYQSMLSELRKFGATFGLATQSLSYLDVVDRSLRATVMANIDHLYAFDMSADDAKLIAQELDGVVQVEDIINLDNFHCYAKLSLAGQRLPVFSLRLDPPPAGDPQAAAHLLSCSTQRYGRAAADVDALLAQIAQTRKLQEDKTKRPAKTTAGGTPSVSPAAGSSESPQSTHIAIPKKPRGTYGAKRKKEPPLTSPEGEQLSRPLLHDPQEGEAVDGVR